MKHTNRPWSKATYQKSSHSLRLVLEPRMVFDGAMLATATDVQQDSVDDKHGNAVDPTVTAETEHNADVAPTIDTQLNAAESKYPLDAAQPDLATSPIIEANNEPSPIIIVVDSRDEKAASLRANPPEDTQIVTIDSTSDGYQQISELLQTRTDVIELHVLPWTDGQTQWLGNKPLTAALEPSTSTALMHWGDSFESRGEVVFHGQTPASSGWLNQVSALTGVKADWSQDYTAINSVQNGGDSEHEQNTAQAQSVAYEQIDSGYFTGASADVAPSLVSVQADAERLVSQFLQQPDAGDQLFTLFNGQQSTPSQEWQEAAQPLRLDILEGHYSIQVKAITNDQISGVLGAFAAQGPNGAPTIFINKDWLSTNPTTETVSRILIEEFGHSLDSKLNGKIDTTGDEGEAFASAVMNFDLSDADRTRIASEDDHSTIYLDGQAYEVEDAAITFTKVYQGTPSSWSQEAQNITTNASAVVGTNFKFVSADPGTLYFSGNNVSGNLVYTDGSGNSQSVSGVISRLIKTGNTVEGLFFYATGPDGLINSVGDTSYIFCMDPSKFAGSTQYGTSSDPVDTALNSFIVPNSAPVASNDTATVTEDSSITANVLTNDTDANADSLTVSAFTISGQAGPFVVGSAYVISDVGSLTMNANGSYTFTPTANYTGAVPAITYTASDGKGGTATANLSISITPVNDPPTSTDDSLSVYANTKTLLTLNDFGTYNDVDGDALSKIKITTLPSTGTLEYYNGSAWVSASANQEFTVADISAGKLRYTGTASESLQFKVSDGTVYSTSAYTLTLTVTANTNVAPDAVNDTNFVYYTTSHSISDYVLPNDNDPDGNNASLVVSQASKGATLGASGATIYDITAGTPFAANNETVTYSSFSVTFASSNKPASNDVVTLSGTGVPAGTTGVVTMSSDIGTIVLDNSAGLTLSNNITLTWPNIAANKTAPTLTPTVGTPNTSVISVSNTAVSLSVGMTVSGTGITSGTTISSISVDPTDSGTRLVKLSQAYTGTLNTNLQFTPAAGATITGTYGTLVIQSDGSYTYTATSSADGSVDTFTYKLSDPNGGTDTATLKITIINGNVAPVNTIGDKTATYGTPLTFSSGLSVSDTNVTSTTLTVGYGTLNATANGSGSVSTNGTSSITLTGTQAEINAMLASLTYTAASGFDSGTDTLKMVSTDAVGLSDTDTVNITVNAPALTVTGTTVNEASAYLMFTVTGSVNQKVTLALGTTGTGDGHAGIGDDVLPNLEYYNGSAWVAYTGGAVSIPNFDGGKLLVRVAVLQDTAYEGAETLKLTATNSSNVAASGNSTIVDDGSGTKYDGTITGTSPTPSTSNPDDDRPLAVNNITVNEASPYAVFEVTGVAGQTVASLALVDGTALGGSDYGTSFQYFNSGTSTWTAYSPSITLDGTGKLLVRTTIINDTATPVYEGAETFGLVATNVGGRSFSGTAVILDDGTGDIYPNNTTGTKDPNPTGLDRDSAVSVTSYGPVNEGSTYAMFTVTGTAGVPLELSLNNGTTALELDSAQSNYAKIEYSYDGSSWTVYTWDGTTGDKPTAPGSSGNGTFYVRVTIASETDTIYEGPETFDLIATTISTGTTLTQSAYATNTIIDNGTGTIYDGTITTGTPTSSSTGLDDDTPTLTVSSPTVTESGGYAIFTVSMDHASTTAVSFTPSLSNGTATLGTDTAAANTLEVSTNGGTSWSTVSGAVTIAAGQTSVKLRLAIVDDTSVESSEGFTLSTGSITGTLTGNTAVIGTATITDNDLSGNHTPVAQNDTGSTAEDTTLTVSAANGLITSTLVSGGADSDADGDSLSITKFTIAGDATEYAAGTTATIAGKGSLTINSNGSYAFVPTANYNGSVPVAIYTLSDGTTTTTATLALTVTAANDVPLAKNNSYTATEDTLLTGKNIITNTDGSAGTDSDVETATASLTIAKVNGVAWASLIGGIDIGHLAFDSWKQVSLTNGTLYFKQDGSTEYQPAPNNTTGDSFTYTVSDGTDESASATVTLSVSFNNAPTISGTSTIYNDTAGDDTFSNFSGTVTAADVDNPTADLRFSLAGSSAASFSDGSVTYDRSKTGSYGAFYLKSTTGEYVYVPVDAAIEALRTAPPAEVYAVTVADPGGKTASANVTINITSVDDTNTITLATLNNFTEQTSVVIAPNATIDAPRDGLSELKITIENSKTGDALSATVGSTGITAGFNATTGFLTLTKAAGGTAAEFEQVLRTVTFSNNLDAPDPADRTFVVSSGSATPYFSHPDGKVRYYEFVSASDIAWQDANAAAQLRTYNGLSGYLATITSAAENAFVVSKLQGNGWMGASDDYSVINAAAGSALYANQTASEGQWYWVTGPEKGVKFWQGKGSANGGASFNGAYSNWGSPGVNNGEPNDGVSHGTGYENFAHLYTDGTWNDYPNNVSGGPIHLNGYVVEYGGNGGDPSVSDIGGAGAAVRGSFTVTRVNDQPGISGTSSTNYTENGTAAVIAAGAVPSDPDQPTHFDTGYLQAQITANGESPDQLTILAVGNITTSGNSVRYNNTEIGLIDVTLNGANNTALKISLNSSASLAATQALMRAIAYSNTSDNPSNAARVVTFTLNDGQNIGTGTALERTATATVNFTSVNDAPTLGTPAISGTYTEGDVTALQFLTGSSVSDPDAGQFNGGSLRIAFVGYVPGDVLSLVSGSNGIIVSGSTVSYNGNEIGTLSGGSAADLVITFTTNNATSAAVDALILQIGYSSTSENPTVSGASPTRAVTVTLNDGGNTSSSGASTKMTATRTGTINVIGINDTPTLTGLDTTSTNTYIQGGTAVIDANALLSDLDLEAAQWTVNNGLLAYYNFDAGATDSSGNNYNGTNNGATSVAGQFGNALSFDGTNNYVSVPLAMTTGRSQFSVGMWVKTTESRASSGSGNDYLNPTLFGMVTSGGDSRDLQIITKAGHIGFYHGLSTGGDISYTSGPLINNDAWHHIALTADGSLLSLYVDGVFCASATATFPLANYNFSIGAANATQFSGGQNYDAHAGSIDDFGFWSRALTAGEIAQIGHSGGSGLGGNNWNGSTLQIARTGSPSSEDAFGNSGNLATLSAASGNVVLSGTTIGSYTQSSGTLSITWNSLATAARVNETLNSLTYRNTVTAPGNLSYDYVDLTLTFNDQNTNTTGGGSAGSGQDQGNLGFKTVTGTIRVNIDRLPVAVADTNSLSEGASTADTSTVGGNVLTDGTDDSDPDSGDTLSVTGVASGTPAGSIATGVGSGVAGSYGSVNVAADGSYTYTLNNTLGAVQALAVGEHLTDTFSYTVSDNRGAKTTVTLTITINGTNDAPQILTGNGDTTQLTTGNANPTFRLAIPATGVVVGDTVRLSYLGVAQPGQAITATDMANGYVDVVLTVALTLKDPTSSLDTVPVKWINWTSYVDSGSTHTVNGTFTTETGTVNATLTNSVGFAFVTTSGGTNYFVPTAPYISTGVAAPTSSDIIAFNPAGNRSLTFSAPVTNLYFAYVSLNGNGYRFDRDFDIISQGQGYWGNGNMVKVTNVINGITYYELNATGGEPHGVIRFKGTFSSVSWSTTVNENWNGFTLGIKSSLNDLQDVKGEFLHSSTIVATTPTTLVTYNPSLTSSTGTLDTTVSSVRLDETNASLSGSGSLTLYDVDTSNAVTVAVDSVAISGVHKDGTTLLRPDLTLTDTEVLSLLTATTTDTNLLQSSKINWAFNSSPENFNWLAEGEELTFTYQITVDDHSGGTDSSTVTVTIVGTNDSPVLTPIVVTGAITEGSASLSCSGSASFADVDLSNTITARVLNDSAVWTGGTLSAGQITALQGGFSITPVTFGNSGTVNWTYTNTEAALNFIAAGQTVTLKYYIEVKDSSNKAVSTLVTITITGANDAPNGMGNTTITGIAEDPATNSGLAINALLGLSFSDTDTTNTLAGIAIVGNTANAGTQGSWQYSSDNGSHWHDIGAVADNATTQALVLQSNATNKLRFVPVANWNGTPPALTVRALDNSYAGSYSTWNGTTETRRTIDPTVNGNATAIAAATNTIGITVTAVNDAPTHLDSTAVILNPITEDTANPAGNTVTNLFSAEFVDSADQIAGGSNANGFAGIAIVSNGESAGTHGVWQYYKTSNSTWTNLPAVSTSNAFVLSPAGQLRFVPVANWNGTPGTLTLQLIDNSAGAVTTESTINVSGDANANTAPDSTHHAGGTSQYSNSSNSVVLTTSVTSVNDAPTVNTLDATPTFAEGVDTAGNRMVIGIPIVLDSSVAIGDIEIVTQSVDDFGGTTLTIARDNGIGGFSVNTEDNFGLNGTVSVAGNEISVSGAAIADITGNSGGQMVITFRSAATSAQVNTIVSAVTYALDSDTPPANVSLRYRFNDDNQAGIQGTGGSLEGDATITVTITAQNDMPLAVDDTHAIIEDAVPNTVTGNVITGVGSPNTSADSDPESDTLTVTALRTGTEGATGSTTPVASGTTGINGTLISGSYGSIRVGADGSYSYQLDNANIAVNQLANGQSLLDYFTYTISDGQGGADTAQISITINGNTDGGPSIVPNNGNGDSSGEADVFEKGLVAPSDNSQTTAGTLAVTAADGMASVTLGGTTFTVADLAGFSTGAPSADIDTGEGTLKVTGFAITSGPALAPTAGTLSYSYTLNARQAHTGATESTDAIALVVTDVTTAAVTGTGTLTVRIVDDVPTANADARSVTERTDTTASTIDGNVFGVTGAETGDVVDRIGADTTLTPVTAVNFGGSSGTIGQALSGSYGSLTLNNDGSYSYSLDNTNAAVNALRNTQTLIETFSYTITDADGDTNSSTLTITINGVTDGTPTIAPNDSNGAGETGQVTVNEAGLTTVDDTSETHTGTVALSAADGLAVVNVGGTAVTLAQLTNLDTTPILVTTPKGTITLTGYTSSSGLGGVSTGGTLTYSYTLTQVQTTLGATENTDAIALTITDGGGGTANGTLTVKIVDDVPTANADANTLNEGTVASQAGNLIGNVFASGGTGDVADRQGADTCVNPVINVIAGNTTPTTSVTSGTTSTDGVSVTGLYGTLVIGANGSYSYDLDDSNTTINALKADSTALTDVFSYQIIDNDGDLSTTTLTITINGITDGAPSIIPVDGNAAATGQTTVQESGLTSVGDSSETATGTFTVAAADGLTGVNVGGTALTLAQLNALAGTPVTVTTPKGAITLTGYTSSSNVGGISTGGTLAYSYTLTHVQNTPGATENTDAIALSITDAGGGTANDTLTVRIVDDTPTANADANSITEDSLTTNGNVFASGSSSDVADRIGADTTATPVTAVNLGGSYGTLALNANGSYSYTLDNSNPAVNALKNGQTLNESFAYTITDADGDTSNSNLIITINGMTDGVPSIVPVDRNGAATGDATVQEAGLTSAGDSTETTTGTVTLTAADGLTSINVGGTTVTLTQLNALSGVPITVTTAKGVFILIGYNSTTNVGSVSTGGALAYSYTLAQAQNTPGELENNDAITLAILDAGGGTASGTLTVDIIDDMPTANPDSNIVSEGTTAATSTSGNIFASGSANDFADRIGADSSVTPVTAVSFSGSSKSVGAAFNSTYGSLTLNANGSYSYTLDNTNIAVNALRNGQTLTETFAYTITDTDGDTSASTLTITINGVTDGEPTITPNDSNGGSAGEVEVYEKGLVAPSDNSHITTGTLAVTAADGMASISLSGTTFTVAQLAGFSAGSPSAGIATGEGTLKVTGFAITNGPASAPIAGTLSYSYMLNARQAHIGGTAAESTDTIALVVTDITTAAATANGTLTVRIVDDMPTANADDNAVTESTTVEATITRGNVFSAGSAGDLADRIGADTTSTPVTAVSFGDVQGTIGQALSGRYGSLTLNSDGSYRYTLDTSNAAVNALKTGNSLSETFGYALADSDGDTGSTTLTITLNGVTDGAPTIIPADGNGMDTGYTTVTEAGLTAIGDTSETGTGTVTLSAADGLASMTVGGTRVTLAQLNTLSDLPVAVTTPKGTLTLTGYSAASAVGGVSTGGTLAYSYTLTQAQNTPGAAEDTDAVALIITDAGGSTADDTLTIRIVDDARTPQAATNPLSEGTTSAATTISGNVFASGSVGDLADRLGADTAATPVTAVSFGAANGTIGQALAGRYGSLTLNGDVSYRNRRPPRTTPVNALKPGTTLSGSFGYALPDSDGATGRTTLTTTLNGVTAGAPTLIPAGGNGMDPGYPTVTQAGLPATGHTSETGTGTVPLSAADGLANVTVGDTTLTLAQLGPLFDAPVSVTTPKGTLTLTGYSAASAVGGVSTGGTLAYSYLLTQAQNTPGAAENTDAIALIITDAGGSTADATLTIRIVDDAPTANADANRLSEDTTTAETTISGNVFASGSVGDLADRIGADTTATPVTAVSFGATNGTIGQALAGRYGSLTLNSDGSYRYTLDTSNTAVNALKTGNSLSETFGYTLADSDGDTGSTTLTITVNGVTDGAPTIIPADGNGMDTGYTTVTEAGLTAIGDTSETGTGTVTLSAADGLANVTVGDTTLTLAQLGTLFDAPVSVTTPKGTLTLTGYSAASAVGGV
ncbi:MAG: VCBS domain-containing protein, partial [Methylococcaceae bacterium]